LRCSELSVLLQWAKHNQRTQHDCTTLAGWTKTHNADADESLLKNKVLVGLKSIAGYRGGYVLRSAGAAEVEFVVVNLFESMEAVQQFAGPDHSVLVFEPEARLLQSRVEPIAMHYEVRVSTV
jgi:hypothetical protein